jgi:hypothetical protein
VKFRCDWSEISDGSSADPNCHDPDLQTAAIAD